MDRVLEEAVKVEAVKMAERISKGREMALLSKRLVNFVECPRIIPSVERFLREDR
jgi:hypothetical protein